MGFAGKSRHERRYRGRTARLARGWPRRRSPSRRRSSRRSRRSRRARCCRCRSSRRRTHRVDRGGTSDPFAKATRLDARGNELKEEPIKTDVVKKTLAPYWGKEACWGAVASADAIAAASVRVQLFDKDTFSTSHDPLGELVLPIAEVLGEGAGAAEFDGWKPLAPFGGMEKAKNFEMKGELP